MADEARMRRRGDEIADDDGEALAEARDGDTEFALGFHESREKIGAS
jgi:hypothetical protein